MTERLRNWAGNLTYGAARVEYPTTVADVQALVAGTARVKALGSRHSFSEAADTTGTLVSLRNLNRVTVLDQERRTVTVEGGITYGELGPVLDAAGWALPNLASLPHIAVAGACATGTHGSGDRNGGLATSASALEVVIADGSVVQFSRERDGDRFDGVVVALGALGVVVRLTLDLVPAFTVRQHVYEELPLAELEAHLDAITRSAYSVSLFTDWQHPVIQQVWLKQRVSDDTPGEAPPAFYGATPATRELHPIGRLPADSCTAQRGAPGPWHTRLPHFRPDHTPSSGDELQSEYFVPRAHAAAAFRAVYALREALAPVLQISEIRTVAGDTLWLSPCEGRDSVALHFTWSLDRPGVERVLPRLEEALQPFGARPHWGKVFTLPPDRLRALYPRLPDFRRLSADYDPSGKFRNGFLERYVAGT